MCARANFRLLLRGLRADSMFAYRSKSSRVSVPLMRMLYPMGHYCSTGFVRSVSLASVKKGGLGSVSLASVKKGGLGWNGLLPFGEYVASSGLLILASPRFSKLWFIFNGLIPRSCSTLPLLSFHLAAA